MLGTDRVNSTGWKRLMWFLKLVVLPPAYFICVWHDLHQRFSIPVLTPPLPPLAYFACLSLLMHLIQIISSLEVRSVHELFRLTCSLYTVSIAPYSLSRGNPLSFTSLQNIHSWFALRNVFKHRRVWHHIPLIYNFNSPTSASPTSALV